MILRKLDIRSVFVVRTEFMISLKMKGPSPTPLLDSATPMPESVAHIVDVFAKELAHVEFPDVSNAILERAAQIVQERTRQVDALRSQVAAAEAELTSARCELSELAARGLAYARVYATGNAELSSKLSALNVSEAPKRKRRKSKKVDNTQPSPTLPVEHEKATAQSTAEQPELQPPCSQLRQIRTSNRKQLDSQVQVVNVG